MRVSRIALCALASLALLPFAACGGGGGGSGSSGGTGDVQFAMTDAPSDSIDLFEVDVRSVLLHREDGSTVEALPRVERIDFADLVSLSNLIDRASVPAGTYDHVALTLDFRTAACHLEGQANLATVLDASGNPFTGPTTVRVHFPSGHPLVVAPGVLRFVELDFDLDASATVDLALNQVRMGTVFVARAEPSDPKPVRAYGRLISVDTAASTITFENLCRRELVRGNAHTAQTGALTKFEVDGTTAQGAAGLALLAAEPVGTRLELQGVFDPAARTYRVLTVEAGRGEYDGARDFIEGLVTARTGGAGADPVLTVKGLGVDRNVSVSFNTAFTVNASFANTKVVKRADLSGHNTNDVNVGQRIVAFGTLTGTTLDATVAGTGLLRLVETDIAGTASGPVSGGVLTANILHIGRRPVSSFNFTVAGTALADPTALKIGTGSLSLPTVTTGSTIVVRGFFVPVDASASGPDFQANRLVDRTGAASLLYVGWSTPNGTPFTSASASGVTVDISAAAVAVADVGGVLPLNLLGGSNPQVVPDPTAGVYAVAEAGSVTLYSDFGTWLSDVQGRLTRPTGAVGAARLAGEGSWTNATRVLTAHRAVLQMK